MQLVCRTVVQREKCYLSTIMIQIKRFVCNMLEENTYIVSDETSEAVIIDCGAYYEEERTAIVQYMKDHQLKPVHLLCTHGHFDHNFGNDTIWQEFGLKPEVAASDEALMDIKAHMSKMFGIPYDRETAPLGTFLSNTVDFGTHQFKVLATPGHSGGSVTFYSEEEQTAFTGDTLFRMSIGRTDFPEGDWPAMQHSLTEVLAKLPAATKIYPGHGEPTTIGDELRYNPYMR